MTPVQPFVFGCSLDVFPPEEVAALTEHGNRLEALAAGRVGPATPAEERFLLMDRGEAEPETLLERAWVRLKGRREFEQTESGTTPPEPPPDYGIIEFDADRCWW